MRCEICKRKVKSINHWMLVFYNLKDVKLCDECDLSMMEQIWEIMGNNEPDI